MGLFDDLIPAAPQTGRPPIPPAGRALLDTIAGSESPGYDVVYGGGKFDDFTDHPRRAVPIASGPNAGRTSSAAGRYQFLGSTWDQVKEEAGLPDFSPDSQDQGAWHLANKTYKAKTGRDLATDLEASQGSPNAIQAIGRQLSGVWTSLPGGIEPNRATMSFASRYDGAAQPVRSTDLSSQGRRSVGLFDDLVPAPSSSPPETSPPVSALPPDDTGGRFTDNPGQSFRGAREGQSPTVATAGEAAKGGFFRGATFNFIDELKALAESGGVDPNDPDGLTAAIGLIKGAYRKATGDPEADAAYRAAVSREREASERMQEQQPGASLAGEVGGALTAPIGAAIRAPTVAGRALQSAGVGAGLGAVAGAGEGDGLADRATRAATGGAIGGAIGGVASPVIDLAARGIGRAAQEAGRYLFPNVERRAATMVDNAARSAAQVDPAARTRLTPAQAAATPESTVADVTGEPGRAIARWAANASPEARETLNAMIDPRFEGQAGRVVGWLNSTFHYPNAAQQREAIDQVERTVNRAAYARAYRDGSDGVWSDELGRLAQSDSVQTAMRAATKNAKDESILARESQFRAGWSSGGSADRHPDLRYWDLVRRELSDAARDAPPSEARRLNGFANALNAELDRLVPSYQQARRGAAGFFGAENALEAGQNFVTRKMTAHDARRALSRMSPQERQLFQDGYVSGFIQRINETGDRRNILNQIAHSPADKERLSIALGPQKASELEAMLRVEDVMNLFRNQVQGNSTTARQLVELGAVSSYAGVGTYMTGDPQTLLHAALAGAFVARGRNTDQRVARRVAEMLTSHDPRVFQRGLNMVASNRRMMENIRGMDQHIARVAGNQSGSAQVPAIQSMGTGRAEDEQPNVPRPPAQ